MILEITAITLAKRAKDIASAAVFLSIVNALVVWGLVLFWQS